MGCLDEELKKSVYDMYGYSVKHMEKVRDHLFLLFTADDCFVLKLFSHAEQLNWQVKCVNQLLEQGARGIVPFVYNRFHSGINEYNGQAFGLMPFIPGQPIDLTRGDHRRASLALLAQFHLKGKGIYGKKPSLTHQSVLFQKWQNQLDQFKQSLPSDLQREELRRDRRVISVQWLQYAKEAILWAESVLAHFPHAFLHYLEEQAQWERQLAHLDIEASNLLVMEDKFFYLVDYDHLDYAPPYVDLIQYLQLVLPFVQWKDEAIEELLAVYETFRPLSKEEKAYLPLLLAYPQDVFRKWLALDRGKLDEDPQWEERFLQEVRKQWEERRRFVQRFLPVLK